MGAFSLISFALFASSSANASCNSLDFPCRTTEKCSIANKKVQCSPAGSWSCPKPNHTGGCSAAGWHSKSHIGIAGNFGKSLSDCARACSRNSNCKAFRFGKFSSNKNAKNSCKLFKQHKERNKTIICAVVKSSKEPAKVYFMNKCTLSCPSGYTKKSGSCVRNSKCVAGATLQTCLTCSRKVCGEPQFCAKGCAQQHKCACGAGKTYHKGRCISDADCKKIVAGAVICADDEVKVVDKCYAKDPCVNSPCSKNADCSQDESQTNKIAALRDVVCKCQDGYSGDGVTCSPDDPCSLNDPCDAKTEICYADKNEQGVSKAACKCNADHMPFRGMCVVKDPCKANDGYGHCDPKKSYCVINYDGPFGGRKRRESPIEPLIKKPDTLKPTLDVVDTRPVDPDFLIEPEFAPAARCRCKEKEGYKMINSQCRLMDPCSVNNGGCKSFEQCTVGNRYEPMILHRRRRESDPTEYITSVQYIKPGEYIKPAIDPPVYIKPAEPVPDTFGVAIPIAKCGCKAGTVEWGNVCVPANPCAGNCLDSELCVPAHNNGYKCCPKNPCGKAYGGCDASREVCLTLEKPYEIRTEPEQVYAVADEAKEAKIYYRKKRAVMQLMIPSAQCTCAPGFYGSPGGCRPKNPCEKKPCKSYEKCTNTGSGKHTCSIAGSLSCQRAWNGACSSAKQWHKNMAIGKVTAGNSVAACAEKCYRHALCKAFRFDKSPRPKGHPNPWSGCKLFKEVKSGNTKTACVKFMGNGKNMQGSSVGGVYFMNKCKRTKCPSGYKLSGKDCINVGGPACPVNSTWHSASKKCQCKSGFKWYQSRCITVAVYNSLNQIGINLPSVCAPGYQKSDGKCHLYDPCAFSNGGCGKNEICQVLRAYKDPSMNEKCLRTKCAAPTPRATCECKLGFKKMGSECKEVDICQNNNGGCPPFKECFQNPKSLVPHALCRCKDGYKAVGRGCVPYTICDQFKRSGHGCDPLSEECVADYDNHMRLPVEAFFGISDLIHLPAIAPGLPGLFGIDAIGTLQKGLAKTATDIAKGAVTTGGDAAKDIFNTAKDTGKDAVDTVKHTAESAWHGIKKLFGGRKRRESEPLIEPLIAMKNGICICRPGFERIDGECVMRCNELEAQDCQGPNKFCALLSMDRQRTDALRTEEEFETEGDVFGISLDTYEPVCQCLKGYSMVEGECVLEDPCETVNCHPFSQECVLRLSMPPQGSCVCKKGFKRHPDGGCVFMHPCEYNNGGCDTETEVCASTKIGPADAKSLIPQVMCLCKRGFSKKGDKCVKDANRCDINNGGCDKDSQICDRDIASRPKVDMTKESHGLKIEGREVEIFGSLGYRRRRSTPPIKDHCKCKKGFITMIAATHWQDLVCTKPMCLGNTAYRFDSPKSNDFCALFKTYENRIWAPGCYCEDGFIFSDYKRTQCITKSACDEKIKKELEIANPPPIVCELPSIPCSFQFDPALENPEHELAKKRAAELKPIIEKGLKTTSAKTGTKGRVKKIRFKRKNKRGRRQADEETDEVEADITVEFDVPKDAADKNREDLTDSVLDSTQSEVQEAIRDGDGSVIPQDAFVPPPVPKAVYFALPNVEPPAGAEPMPVFVAIPESSAPLAPGADRQFVPLTADSNQGNVNEECPECWMWDDTDEQCVVDKSDKKCYNLQCHYNAMELDFSTKLFAVPEGEENPFVDGADIVKFDKDDQRWESYCKLGDCGMTLETREVDEVEDFDGVHLVFGIRITVQRQHTMVKGHKIYLKNPIRSSVLFQCAYREDVKISSTEYMVHAIDADGEAISYGNLEHGFEITLYTEPDFDPKSQITDDMESPLFIGQPVYTRVEWKVSQTSTGLSKIANFYVEDCQINLPQDRVMGIISENCYSSTFGVEQLQKDKIVESTSDFKFTSFIVDKGATTMKMTVQCNIKVCSLVDKKCDDWITTKDTDCPKTGDDLAMAYKANTFNPNN